MERAEERLEFEGLERLIKEGKEYDALSGGMVQTQYIPFLQYNTFTKEWTELGGPEQLARAGAGAVLKGDSLIIVNGELKPGIRTPQVNYAEITK